MEDLRRKLYDSEKIHNFRELINRYETFYSDLQGFWRDIYDPDPDIKHDTSGGTYKEERKYVELYVFFSLSGNGVKNETCEYIESPKNEMYKEYAIGYNNAINKLKAEGYSKVKGFVLSHAPLNTKHMIKDFNESKVVYSTNEKACNKNYRSGYKYVLSNRQMENAILVTKDKNDKKVSSNLTFVNFFDRIVTLDKAEDGMDKKTFTWKKNEDGKSYQKLVKTHDGLHWDKKTTKMMMPIILEEAGF